MTVPAWAQDADFSADIAEITQRFADAEKVVASYDWWGCAGSGVTRHRHAATCRFAAAGSQG